MTVPVPGRAEIEAAARPGLVPDAVRAALIAHAAGRTTVPAPTHLNFPAADGDCHVKTGWIDGSDDFTVKIASGFRAGAVPPGADVPLGTLLLAPPERTATAVTIADLTGVGALDAAVASAVVRELPH
ncbi:hypothetical protein ABZ461_13160 [Actinacidiphila glaucinigra]|uniref:hypothetical protein n=1 Tax=Actinacidiphila glaucinigra TaxID=235986 RepID=UPI00340847CD